MKKSISIILGVIMICTAMLPRAFANESFYVEAKYHIYDNHIYYVRLDQNVVGVGEKFRVEYTPKGQNTVFALNPSHCSISFGDRMEVIMQFPDYISDFTLYDLVLQDGTLVQQYVKNDSGFSSVGDMSDVWALKKHDVFYSYSLIGKDKDVCFVTVGSEWELRFTEYSFPRDPYLRKYISLEGDGIELQKDEEKYIFQSYGDGEVSLCMFGVPCKTVEVRVRDKSEIRQKMLLTVPVESLAVAFYSVHWLGLIALAVALPVAAGYTVVTFIRMFFA